jgi:hypothetical protein
MIELMEKVAWYNMTVLRKNPTNNAEKPALVNIIVMLPPLTIPPNAMTTSARIKGATR